MKSKEGTLPRVAREETLLKQGWEKRLVEETNEVSTLIGLGGRLGIGFVEVGRGSRFCVAPYFVKNSLFLPIDAQKFLAFLYSALTNLSTLS
jgi:hypothetical protein